MDRSRTQEVTQHNSWSLEMLSFEMLTYLLHKKALEKKELHSIGSFTSIIKRPENLENKCVPKEQNTPAHSAFSVRVVLSSGDNGIYLLTSFH